MKCSTVSFVFSSGIAVDKQKDLSRGELADTMKMNKN